MRGGCVSGISYLLKNICRLYSLHFLIESLVVSTALSQKDGVKEPPDELKAD
jgi:hypothetical protein